MKYFILTAICLIGAFALPSNRSKDNLQDIYHRLDDVVNAVTLNDNKINELKPSVNQMVNNLKLNINNRNTINGSKMEKLSEIVKSVISKEILKITQNGSNIQNLRQSIKTIAKTVTKTNKVDGSKIKKEAKKIITFNDRNQKTVRKITKLSSEIVPSEVPDSWDWREKGAVSPVKNETVCGAWLDALNGALEGAVFIATGELQEVSSQELIDCADACNADENISVGYDYILANGISAATQYPDNTTSYETCRRGKIPSVVDLGSYASDLYCTDEEMRDYVVNVGPISVYVDASTWQLYTGGILECKSHILMLNHAALLVGYGSENGVDYWVLRNSWGTQWGEEGYIRVRRKDMVANCGLSTFFSYPLLGSFYL